MSIVDYVDRTIDVVAYQGSKPRGNQLLTSELATPDQSGLVCTGVVKLAQKFLLKLFKERGSKLYRPTEGNDFMTEARQGLLRNQVDVFTSFSAALVDIRREFAAEETDDLPPDERFGSAELLGVTVQPGRVSISVQITSQNDTTTKFITPLPITIGG